MQIEVAAQGQRRQFGLAHGIDREDQEATDERLSAASAGLMLRRGAMSEHPLDRLFTTIDARKGADPQKVLHRAGCCARAWRNAPGNSARKASRR